MHVSLDVILPQYINTIIINIIICLEELVIEFSAWDCFGATERTVNHPNFYTPSYGQLGYHSIVFVFGFYCNMGLTHRVYCLLIIIVVLL